MKEKKKIQHRRLTGKHLPQLTLFYFEDTKLLFFLEMLGLSGLQDYMQLRLTLGEA